MSKRKLIEQKDSGNENITRREVSFEIKQLDDSDPDFFIFEGLAAAFGNIDSHNDIILPGAFTKSLETRTPVILWQHDMWQPIGMPLEMRETAEGLFVKGRLPRNDDLVKGRVIPQMRVGSIKAMSIGFHTVASEMNDEAGVRLLKEVELMEFSLVTFASNDKAAVTDFKNTTSSITVEQVKKFTPRQLEKTLRESGFSKDASVYLVSKFPKQGEPGNELMQKKAIGTLNETLDLFTLKQLSSAIDKIN